MAWFRKENGKKEMYKMEVICANCCNVEEVDIKKGMKTEAFCKTYI